MQLPEAVNLDPSTFTNRQMMFITDQTGRSLLEVQTLLENPSAAGHRDLLAIAAALIQPDDPQAAFESLLDEPLQVVVDFGESLETQAPEQV